MRGFDFDARKIASARAALARSGAGDMEFWQGDARGELPAHHGSVTILDILQFIPPEEQSALLTAAAGKVSADGLLVIRSGLAMPGWRVTDGSPNAVCYGLTGFVPADTSGIGPAPGKAYFSGGATGDAAMDQLPQQHALFFI